jgi:SHS2 domain-containing protein
MVEHTGDLAVRLRAPHLSGLIQTGIFAMRALLFEGTPGSDAPVQDGRARVSGVDREDVLVQALSEALHMMQGDALFPHTVRIEVPEDGEARLWLEGVRADGERLRQVAEIKAVTYHAVEIQERDGQLETLVVLDV